MELPQTFTKKSLNAKHVFNLYKKHSSCIFLNSYTDIEEYDGPYNDYGPCPWDYIAINGERYCGTHDNPDEIWHTLENSVNFAFEADDIIPKEGFKLEFSCSD